MNATVYVCYIERLVFKKHCSAVEELCIVILYHYVFCAEIIIGLWL